MTSQPGKRTIAIYTLTNISRSKGSWTINFGQLIEYNMRNIFADRYRNQTENVEKLFPGPFLKNQNMNIFLDSKFYKSLF